MADIFSRKKRSDVMSKIRAKNTKPEIAVRQYLFAQGFRFRIHRKDLPGNPDIILPKHKVVIFVQGCFWHGHPCKIGSGDRKPKTNKKYWNGKIQKNIDRHKKNKRLLKKMGWQIIDIWECETKVEGKLCKKIDRIKKVWKIKK